MSKETNVAILGLAINHVRLGLEVSALSRAMINSESLEQSVQRVITKTKLVFRDWVDTLEEGSSDSDIFMKNVSAHQKIAIELVDLDMDFPEGSKVYHAQHLEHAQDLIFGDEH